MDYIKDRLTEKSTWVGIVAFLGAVGITIGPELQQHIIAIGVAVFGLLNVLLKEQGSK